MDKREEIEDENIKRIIAVAMAPTPVRKVIIQNTPEKNQATKIRKNNDKKKLRTLVTVVYSVIVIFTFTHWYLMLLLTFSWALIIISLKDDKKDDVKNSKKR